MLSACFLYLRRFLIIKAFYQRHCTVSPDFSQNTQKPQLVRKSSLVLLLCSSMSYLSKRVLSQLFAFFSLFFSFLSLSLSSSSFLCSISLPLLCYRYVSGKYRVLYIAFPQYESGGVFWPDVFTRMCIGLLLSELTLIGVFGLKQVPVQAGFLVPLPFLTFVFWRYVRNEFYAYSLWSLMWDYVMIGLRALKVIIHRPTYAKRHMLVCLKHCL